MRSLSQIILLLTLSVGLYAQSPHGKDLTMACSDCHNPKGWKLEQGTYSFTHDKTQFPLLGRHDEVNCKLCHPSLVFSEAKAECVSCHTDMHYQTVGMECERCHTPKSWLVDNINDIHRQSRFPLVGAHLTADCYSCHPSASLLRFEPLGVECYDCHQKDYQGTTSPNHSELNYSTECLDCHKLNAFSWIGTDINHSFFPLVDGHANVSCNECHKDAANYGNISKECFSCHQKNYNEASNPNHITADFSTICDECHSLQPDWKPAKFTQHDGLYFPIYSGKHRYTDVWNNCSECHTNANNFASNSCTICHDHNQSDMAEAHNEVGGYAYNDAACLECHPTGVADDNSFDHNQSNFPLTGAHITTECLLCHANGFAGTTTICGDCHNDVYTQTTNPNHIATGISNDCAACHTTEPGWIPATFDTHNDYYLLSGAHATIANDCFSCHAGDYNNTPNICFGCHTENYNQTTNPNHNAIGIETDCETCHTTNPEWKPATFPTHNNYYALIGAHATIANDCFTCHNGNYVNTPNTCYACHTADYNQTNNPPHQAAQFPTNCEECHTQSVWVPSTFNHDGLYFPIYSGKHDGEWNQCSDCHTNPGNYAIFTCVTSCHPQGETNSQHQGISGYQYNSDACLACHPDGSAGGAFNHNATNFPLTGAHTTVECSLCHVNGYSGTSTICSDCHTSDFNQSTNPNHSAIGIPNECETCHTTNPNWQPATFPIHNSYYVLTGAHVAIANDCFTCHNGNYNNTPNTCYACHVSDYNQTNNPPHQSAQFPTDCESCHIQSVWVPSTFDHDGQYFPIYSGHHNGEWDQCSDCHTNPGNYSIFTCITCHQQNQTNNEHQGVTGYQYNSEACFACHPDGSGSGSFNHNSTNFPLTGAHTTVECSLCHVNGYSGTSTICSDCHTNDFNQTTNPNHSAIGIPNECETCHTTNPNWQPATFPIHNSYYVLAGAHVAIANNCMTCHNGNYNNTPNTCYACHVSDYNQTNNPPHQSAQFPTDCESCHSQNVWVPSTFDHDGQYFPIYSGHHNGEWDQCSDCHTNPGNYSIFTCITCHQQNQMNNEHQGISGYQYNSEACFACHPDGSGAGAFNHSGTNFPLTGAHTTVACNLCHVNGYAGTTTVCGDCHNSDYNQSTNPNHNALSIPQDCSNCHTTAPNWQPATFGIHNNYYALTGAHASISGDCFSCHAGNYNNTPNVCNGCHSGNYNQTINPNHTAIGISNNCETCHTTNPDWQPATFPTHNNYYALIGAHAAIATDCFTCHNGNYNNTPNTCYACHVSDYNQTSNPPHQSAQFPTECVSCHTQNAWNPSTFNHDGQYFPIYSGQHNGEWNQCSDCHTNSGNYSIFTCITCHSQSQTNQQHNGVSGYTYNSDACFACHPDGSSAGAFNHSATNFPLTGAHTTVACNLCHVNGYVGTTTICGDCHAPDYNQSTNPNHNALGISNNCASCHTTAPDWQPATFGIHNNYYLLTGAHASISGDCFSCHAGNYNNTPNVCNGCHSSNYNQTTNPNHTAIGISNNCETCHTTNPNWQPATFPTHNNYYALIGAHATIATDCFTCHNGNYNNTPNTCYACHTSDYNQTNNPPHQSAQFPVDCETCHSQTGWQPSTFDHDGQYFPIYTGSHNGQWNQCSQCHNNAGNFAIFTCFTCHDQNGTNSQHTGITGYTYNSDACIACHPDGSGGGSFNHSTTSFPLTGAHTTVACNLCHVNGYAGTTTVCGDCHGVDYSQSTNPNHNAIGISNNCATCHTTAPDWQPATFPVHNNYYVLAGAHVGIASDCFTCHNGNYNNTPNTCYGCHSSDYNQTNDPPHQSAQFPTECEDCHSQNAWQPSTFNHDSQYFPIYSGKHNGEWDQCIDCHTTPGNYALFDCIHCHTNAHHQSQGNNGCYNCHPNGNGGGKNLIKEF